ncbi:MAG: CHAT domain-containing tetratricopeptide repeat protein [Bacteroidota bacterium]
MTIVFPAFTQGWQSAYNDAISSYYESDYRKTIDNGKNALSLASNNNEELYSLKILSATCNEIGNYKKGVEYAKLEIEICSILNVPDTVYISSLNNLINNYLGLHEFKNAIPYQQKIVNLGNINFAPDNLEHNQHISDLGYSYLMTNEYDSAIHFLTKANKRLVNIEGGAEDFLINQLNIGQAYYQKHEFITSLQVLQGLKEILENNQLTDYQIYAEVLESLGSTQYRLSHFKEAQQSYEIASTKYQQFGFSINDLEPLNQHLALAYLKNEQTNKSDSIQSLYGTTTDNQNLIVNQLTLAYKKYASEDYRGSKTIVNTVLKTATDKELLAEAIMLNARLNLKLHGNSLIDSINISINTFFSLEKIDKSAEAVHVKSRIYRAQGQNKKAIESLLEARNMIASTSENYDLKYRIAVDILDVNLQLKKIEEANTFYKKCVSTRLLAGSEYENRLAYTYALLLQVNGYNLQALEVIKTKVDIISYPELTEYQKLQAKVYLDLGQANKSLTIYENLDQYFKAQNPSSVDYGENLTQLGRVKVVLGEFAEAEEYYKKGITVLESSRETPARVFAPAYNSFAIYQQTIGSYGKAKDFYARAKFFSKDNLSLKVDIIQNLATLHQHEGEYYEAIVLLNEATEAYKSIYGDLHPYYATALQNLANAHNKYGDPLKAIELLERAIIIDKRSGLENSISYSNKLHNLAVILQEVDEYDRAKELFTTVLANRRQLLSENHPDYIYSLYNMAVLTQKMGDCEEAKEHFIEVIEKYDFQINSFFPYLSEEEKSKYYAKINEAFTAFQDFAAEYSSINPSINASLYNFQLNHKAILLKSSRSIKKAIDKSQDPGLIKLYNHWISLKTDLAKYYSMSQKELELSNISIQEVVNEANELEKQLSLKSSLFETNTQEKKHDWKDVQSKLKENEAAIELLRIRKNIRNDSVWYAAIIVTPRATNPELVILPDGLTMENKLFKVYINSIKFKRTDKYSYKNFWQSIDSVLPNIEKIYLSTDGIYNKINISSLYDPEKEEYILNRTIIHNVTNTSEILEDVKELEIEEGLLLNLAGDPIFATGHPDEFNISSLPGTRVEIETVDSLAKNNNINSIKLLGAGVNEKNIKSIESPSILHIATHGFFLADNKASNDMYSIENNPLMRSGLLLTGSEKYFRGDHIDFSGSLDEEDGILTAYEAATMNLANTDLVILSACETGLGEVKNGEGVYGLNRAFVLAGARSVMISLWKVNDESTKELMIVFYQNILKGYNKFEAINLAQKELQKKYDVPYYWGAFILSGV